MFFTKKSIARSYIKQHAPEFRERLAIVPCKVTVVQGDCSDDTKAEDITFAQKVGFTVVLTK